MKELDCRFANETGRPKIAVLRRLGVDRCFHPQCFRY
jgi:hypothetical protein